MSDTPTSPASTSPTSTSPTSTPRPGFRSSEFWLSTIATVGGILLASGVLPAGGMAAQITGGVLAVLSSLGYTASRTSLKKSDPL